MAYAIWSGAGTALTAAVAIIGFHESLTTLKIVSLVLIVLGVVGLELRRWIPLRKGLSDVFHTSDPTFGELALKAGPTRRVTACTSGGIRAGRLRCINVCGQTT